MDLPQPGEGALAQPTRARVFAFLTEKKAAASTDEIAARLRLHPNGVRRHLERLEEEGLVARGRLRGGQGRPRDSWSVAPHAHPGGEHPRAYGDLARWLVRAISAGPARAAEVEAAGREIGRELAPRDDADALEGMREAFAAMGFEPEFEERPGGGFCCRLGNCPYRDSAYESAEVVCGLHRGLTEGLLSVLDPEATLVSFEPHDPGRAGCVVDVAGGAPR
jgi:predicted ArsR family transcriptional regulator